MQLGALHQVRDPASTLVAPYDGEPVLGGRRSIGVLDQTRITDQLTVLAPVGSQPDRDAVATSVVSERSEAATIASCRGGWLATSSLGRSWTVAGTIPSTCASSGSTLTARSARTVARASGSAPEGKTSDPTRRHAPGASDEGSDDRGRADIEGEEGAGSLVT